MSALSPTQPRSPPLPPSLLTSRNHDPFDRDHQHQRRAERAKRVRHAVPHSIVIPNGFEQVLVDPLLAGDSQGVGQTLNVLVNVVA